MRRIQLVPKQTYCCMFNTALVLGTHSAKKDKELFDKKINIDL